MGDDLVSRRNPAESVIAFSFNADILFAMDEEPARPTPPVLDELDAAAVKTILMRVIRAQDDSARLREMVREANAKITENNLVNTKAITALAFFGFQAPQGVNVWNMVRDALGNEAYDRAIDDARGVIPKLLAQMGVEGEAEKTTTDTVEARGVKKPTVQIRTAILDYMRSVGGKGAKAGEVRQHLSDAYGITVHDKTPGMTLYRLSKDGLVKRKGRNWYAVEGKKENEASSADTGDASETALAAQ